MKQEIIRTPEAPEPVGPYSQGVRAGPFLFLSGQVAVDPESGDLTEGDIRAQTKKVLENAKAIVKAAGARLENVIKVTAFLANAEDYPGMNEAYGSYFRRAKPARTTVVSQLPNPKMLVEMDFIVLVS
ncbi:MAG: RidA family protein [Candidatus Geothermarchaeales archaeon]